MRYTVCYVRVTSDTAGSSTMYVARRHQLCVALNIEWGHCHCFRMKLSAINWKEIEIVEMGNG
jgi:hypothetical protein